LSDSEGSEYEAEVVTDIETEGEIGNETEAPTDNETDAVGQWWLGADDVNDRPVRNPKRTCDEYSSKFSLSYETKV
jgi:hypothetical protein